MPITIRRRDAWVRLPVNARLLEAERQLLRETLDELFGYHLLMVGGWGRHVCQPHASRIRQQSLVDAGPSGATVIAEPGALPIASASVDAVVLPHTLELAVDPHAVLREASRVLVGDGRLIVLGFSPVSPWRLRVPWTKSLVSRKRLTDWLTLLDFEVVQVDKHSWTVPFGFPRLDAWCQRRIDEGWPLPAGAYFVVARKRVVPLIMVGRARLTPLSRFTEALPR